ncbi:MAG: alcohol dehydrogenase catalytic domain-containing protein [Candidatus Marinimicrobia bacterium]|nr:alcohol dehydrogenase catalytic domain-containing protein [Candidatus Neomarinimicrobiota bacterium]MCF7880150.1 alcohol dehydrogenase catalytic domain-containing protein [Candidatus Neomarinimicrobiota bacterium]
MQVVNLIDLKKFKVMDEPPPSSPGAGEVLLKVQRVGICGSDIHYYLEGGIGEQVIDFPYTVGHEFSGAVEETGAGVTNVKQGDLVAVEPAVSCGQCDQCREGRPHTCRKLKFIGAPSQLSGAMKEYIVLPAENCFPVPNGMSPEAACLVEPLSIGCYAVELARKQKGKTAAILGAGPIGLSVLEALKELSPDTIYATDKLDYRLSLASDAGAGWTGNPDKCDIVKEVRALEPLGLDSVFECCGDQEALDQAIDLLKPGGELLIVGIPSEDRISFDISKIRRKEITIKNVRRQNHCVEPAIDLIHNNPEIENRMYTHGFQLEDTGEAFEIVSGYRDRVMKAMIHIS